MLGTRKEDNGRIYSAGTGLATVCTAQFFYRFTFKLTLKQACFTFQGTALNMPLTHKLPRPFSRATCGISRHLEKLYNLGIRTSAIMPEQSNSSFKQRILLLAETRAWEDVARCYNSSSQVWTSSLSSHSTKAEKLKAYWN